MAPPRSPRTTVMMSREQQDVSPGEEAKRPGLLRRSASLVWGGGRGKLSNNARPGLARSSASSRGLTTTSSRRHLQQWGRSLSLRRGLGATDKTKHQLDDHSVTSRGSLDAVVKESRVVPTVRVEDEEQQRAEEPQQQPQDHFWLAVQCGSCRQQYHCILDAEMGQCPYCRAIEPLWSGTLGGGIGQGVKAEEKAQQQWLGAIRECRSRRRGE